MSQLLSQVETLLAHLEAGERLTPQAQLSLSEVKTLATAGVTAPP